MNKKSSKNHKNKRKNQEKTFTCILIVIIIILFLIIVIKNRKHKKVKDSFYVKPIQYTKQKKERFQDNGIQTLLDKPKIYIIKDKNHRYLTNELTIMNNNTEKLNINKLNIETLNIYNPEKYFKTYCEKKQTDLELKEQTAKMLQAQSTYYDNEENKNENKKIYTDLKTQVNNLRKNCTDESKDFCKLENGICVINENKLNSDANTYNGKIVTINSKPFLIEKHPKTINSYALRVIESNNTTPTRMIITNYYFGIDPDSGKPSYRFDNQNKYYWDFIEYNFEKDDKNKARFLSDIVKHLSLDTIVKDTSDIDIEMYNSYYKQILDKIFEKIKEIKEIKEKEKFDDTFIDIYKYDKFMNRMLTQINGKAVKTKEINSLFHKIEEIYTIILDNNIHDCCKEYNKITCDEKKSQ